MRIFSHMNTVRTHRDALGWSREALGRKAEVSASYIYQLEAQGDDPEPTTLGIDLARRLADALGVDVDILFPPAAPSSADSLATSEAK